MSNEFNKVNELIKSYFGDDIISLVIFGSSCKKRKFKIISDLDYLIVTREKVLNQDKISRSLKKYLSNYYALLSFNIYDKQNFINLVKTNDWLVLSLKLGYFIIYDKRNFFYNKIENQYKTIKAKKIAPLGWYIKKGLPNASLIDHLRELSSSYLKSSKAVFQEKIYNIANLLLLNSIHCYLSALMLEKNIFITKGEIIQCFIKIYDLKFKDKFRNELLEIEQVCGQIEKISFNFDRNGKMKYIENKKYLKKFYKNKLKIFSELKVIFK